MSDPLLAIYGDWFYGAALLVYTLALLLEIVEYGFRREPAKALVTVGVAHPTGDVEGRDVRTRSDRFGRMAVSLLALGTLLHLSSIVLRGLSAGRWPMGNMYEYISAVCLAAIVGWLVMVRRAPSMRPVGIFVVPVVLVLMFLGGTLLYTASGPVVPALQSYWMIFHVSTAVVSSGLFLLPGVASCLYLLRRSDRLRRFAERLPVAQALDRVAYRVTVAAFPLYTFGLICGAIWAEAAWGRFWGWDPKETVAFVAWVVYAAYLHARATAGWRAPRAAWINVGGFTMIVFNLFFVNLIVAGLHSYAGL
ncbi:c-type cytochrome biogenesis protein CcsB [Pseudonocardia xinjiangensis]|uniref:C-type cytochrome biogenesis protein CcsB n=1 Tax=Pseudonocardia xinjiangensis TaxID=75289 RepID=A0ABX1RAH4_9PSEU|nr:c-type cytochrome biogenesis protein CcsB [Pseudonocardia xinjiangensis]NMH76405.1 c-type cytochrome biogenesis protein CcsB [Pseudonocardia xinjiangensis]